MHSNSVVIVVVFRYVSGKLEERLLQAGQQQAERHQQPHRVQEAALRPVLLPRKRPGRRAL